MDWLIIHLKPIKLPKPIWMIILQMTSWNYYGKLKWEFKLGFFTHFTEYSLEKIALEANYVGNIHLLIKCAEKGFICEGFTKMALRQKRIDLLKKYNLLKVFYQKIRSYNEIKLFLVLLFFFCEAKKKNRLIILKYICFL